MTKSTEAGETEKSWKIIQMNRDTREERNTTQMNETVYENKSMDW